MFKKIVRQLTLLSALVAPASAFAQLSDPPQFDGFVAIIDNVIQLVMNLIPLIAVGMIVYAGYLWMMAGGDAQKIQRAQGTITWVVIGVVFLGIFRWILAAVVRGILL